MIDYDHWFEHCDEHDECIVHVSETVNERTHERDDERGVPRGTHKVIQRSHQHESIDPAFRMNVDYPDCADRRRGAKKGDRVRWRLADDAAIESEHFPWDCENRRQMAAVAATKGLGSIKDLAEQAGVAHEDLLAEAVRKRWIQADHAERLRVEPDTVKRVDGT